MASKIIDKAKSALGKDKSSTHLAGHSVGPTGYGLMGLTWRAQVPSQEQSFSAMKAALANGANFWNGGEIYGSSQRNSLHLLREYFDKYPGDASKVVISIKGGMVPDTLNPSGTEENTKRSIEEALNVLGDKKKLDLWESARVDDQVPIEITMREAKKYVDSGKIGGVCLSECSADTIRRASKVVKISAVEVEFSLWETTILENGVAAACAELDIPIVAYSPLGRGILTGQIKSPDDIADNDLRKHMPRYQGENFYKNLELVKELEKLAQRKGYTTAQVGLAWVRAQGSKPDMPTIIPIPGATTVDRVNENMASLELNENDLKEIDSLLESIEIAGDRYPKAGSKHLFGNSPELKE